MLATHQTPHDEQAAHATPPTHHTPSGPDRARALDTPELLDLLDAYLDGTRSLLSIAREFHLSLTQLAELLASPEIVAELDALTTLTEQRTAHIAASCRPDALLVLQALLQAPNPHAPDPQHRHKQHQSQADPAEQTGGDPDPNADPNADPAAEQALAQSPHPHSPQAGDPKLIAKHHEFRRRVATTLLRESHPPRPQRTPRTPRPDSVTS